jgi:hypothetical protein
MEMNDSFEDLVSRLNSTDKYERIKALAQLWRTGEKSIPLLIEALNDSEETVRVTAIVGFGKVGITTPEVISALHKGLEDTSRIVRCQVVRVLGELHAADETTISGIRKAFRDPDPNVRACAPYALRNLGPAAREAIPELIRALEDEDASVRRGSAAALSAIGPAAYEALEPLVTTYLRSKKRAADFIRDEVLASQCKAIRLACIEYLEERLQQACQGRPGPSDPWSEMALLTKGSQSEKLFADSEQIRGVIATLDGVLRPDPPDTEAVRLALDHAEALLEEGNLKAMENLDDAFNALSIDKESLPGLNSLPSLLYKEVDLLERQKFSKARQTIKDIQRILQKQGMLIRWQILKLRGISPSSEYKCDSCDSTYFQPITKKTEELYKADPLKKNKTKIQCQVCGIIYIVKGND